MSAPELLIVVDTEEEFDWTKPFDRANTGTRSILAQARAQEIFGRLGIVPTYVIDYPIAVCGEGASYLRSLREAGAAEIGAHLHAWVTPPHDERVTTRNSYQCNLSPELEWEKLQVLTAAIADVVGARPTSFKAGRHGFGPATARHLVELGYNVDCSLLPHHDLRRDGGPNFLRAADQPHWREDDPALLEIPVTTGFFGMAPRIARWMPGLFDNALATGLRVPGLLARSDLVSRSRLSPEGISALEQCRLLDQLIREGKTTFSLVYHSPSLAPGHTPYVRTEDDLKRFLDRIETVLTYFRDAHGGRFTSLSQVHARMSEERALSAGEAPARKDRRARQRLDPVRLTGR